MSRSDAIKNSIWTAFQPTCCGLSPGNGPPFVKIALWSIYRIHFGELIPSFSIIHGCYNGSAEYDAAWKQHWSLHVSWCVFDSYLVLGSKNIEYLRGFSLFLICIACLKGALTFLSTAKIFNTGCMVFIDLDLSQRNSLELTKKASADKISLVSFLLCCDWNNSRLHVALEWLEAFYSNSVVIQRLVSVCRR